MASSTTIRRYNMNDVPPSSDKVADLKNYSLTELRKLKASVDSLTQNATAPSSVFTSTAAGVVPPSGGGTVNFLRADGTWARPPALNNSTTSITTTTTVSNAVNGATIVLSGTGSTAAVNTLIFAAATGYDANFQVMVLNADTRGWSIAPNAFNPFILWPGQSKIVFNQGNVWHWNPYFERWSPNSGSFTMNVDPSLGSDSNDGLGTGAGAKLNLGGGPNGAWRSLLALTEGPASIQLLPGGAFGAIGEIDGDFTGSFGRNINVLGDPTLVNPPVITVPAGQIGIKMRDGAWATLNGLAFVSSGAGAIAVDTEQYGGIDLQNIRYGAFPGGVHVNAVDGSQVNVSGAEVIVGTASSHWLVEAQSKLVVGSVTISGGLNAFNFATGFVLASALARVAFGAAINFSQCGNFTGGGYALTRHSILESNGTAPPGGAGSQDATSNFY
jgi:hypothetical protein